MMKYLLIDKSELIWKYNLFITTGVNALPLILSWGHFYYFKSAMYFHVF